MCLDSNVISQATHLLSLMIFFQFFFSFILTEILIEFCYFIVIVHNYWVHEILNFQSIIDLLNIFSYFWKFQKKNKNKNQKFPPKTDFYHWNLSKILKIKVKEKKSVRQEDWWNVLNFKVFFSLSWLKNRKFCGFENEIYDQVCSQQWHLHDHELTKKGWQYMSGLMWLVICVSWQIVHWYRIKNDKNWKKKLFHFEFFFF